MLSLLRLYTTIALAFLTFFLSIVTVYASDENRINQVSYQNKQHMIVNKKRYYTIIINYPKLKTQKNSNIAASNKLISDKIKHMIDYFEAAIAPAKELQTLHERSAKLPLNEKSNILKLSYRVLMDAYGILSIRFEENSYVYGAAHPNTHFMTVNIELNSGKVLRLYDIFKTNTDYLVSIADYARQQLKHSLIDNKGNAYNESYQQRLENTNITTGTKAVIKNYQHWNITNSGLLITFPPYQVAPYYYGPIEVVVPYSVIKKVIKEDSPLKPLLQNIKSRV